MTFFWRAIVNKTTVEPRGRVVSTFEVASGRGTCRTSVSQFMPWSRLPSGNQTWQWKMDLWSVIFLWKPLFIGDCPFPCLLTSWKMIYRIIIPASTVFHRDRIVSETCAGLLPSGKRLSGAHKSNSAAHTAKTQPRTQIWLSHAHRSDSRTHTDLTHSRTQNQLSHTHT